MSYGVFHKVAVPEPVWSANSQAECIGFAGEDTEPFYAVDILRDGEDTLAAFAATEAEALGLAARVARLLNLERRLAGQLRDARAVLAAADRSKAWQSERMRCRAACEALLAEMEQPRIGVTAGSA